jgi:hypothetical protein
MPWIGRSYFGIGRRLAQPETVPQGDGPAAQGAGIPGPPGGERGSRSPVTAKSGELLRRYGGSALLLAAFLAIPLWLLGNNLAGSGSAVTLPSPEPLGTPTDGYFGTPATVYSAGTAADFCVVFEFLGVDQATSYVNVGILIGITQSGRTMLGPGPVPKDGQLVFASESGLSTFAVKFPLSPLTAHPVTCASMINPPVLEKEAQYRIIQQVFALGTPQSFPNDWYQLNDRIGVTVADSPMSSSLIVTSRDAGWALTANSFRLTDGSTWASRISIIARRHLVVVLYTYFIALMPAALLIGIFWLVYQQKKSGKLPARSLPGATEVAFGVAATMVAILPLRAVLVPDSLPAPTRLDVVFGLQIALLVALSIIWIKKTAGWQLAPEPLPGDQPSVGDGAKAAGQAPD